MFARINGTILLCMCVVLYIVGVVFSGSFFYVSASCRGSYLNAGHVTYCSVDILGEYIHDINAPPPVIALNYSLGFIYSSSGVKGAVSTDSSLYRSRISYDVGVVYIWDVHTTRMAALAGYVGSSDILSCGENLSYKVGLCAIIEDGKLQMTQVTEACYISYDAFIMIRSAMCWNVASNRSGVVGINYGHRVYSNLFFTCCLDITSSWWGISCGFCCGDNNTHPVLFKDTVTWISLVHKEHFFYRHIEKDMQNIYSCDVDGNAIDCYAAPSKYLSKSNVDVAIQEQSSSPAIVVYIEDQEIITSNFLLKAIQGGHQDMVNVIIMPRDASIARVNVSEPIIWDISCIRYLTLRNMELVLKQANNECVLFIPNNNVFLSDLSVLTLDNVVCSNFCVAIDSPCNMIINTNSANVVSANLKICEDVTLLLLDARDPQWTLFANSGSKEAVLEQWMLNLGNVLYLSGSWAIRDITYIERDVSIKNESLNKEATGLTLYSCVYIKASLTISDYAVYGAETTAAHFALEQDAVLELYNSRLTGIIHIDMLDRSTVKLMPNIIVYGVASMREINELRRPDTHSVFVLVKDMMLEPIQLYNKERITICSGGLYSRSEAVRIYDYKDASLFLHASDNVEIGVSSDQLFFFANGVSAWLCVSNWKMDSRVLLCDFSHVSDSYLWLKPSVNYNLFFVKLAAVNNYIAMLDRDIYIGLLDPMSDCRFTRGSIYIWKLGWNSFFCYKHIADSIHIISGFSHHIEESILTEFNINNMPEIEGAFYREIGFNSNIEDLAGIMHVELYGCDIAFNHFTIRGVTENASLLLNVNDSKVSGKVVLYDVYNGGIFSKNKSVYLSENTFLSKVYRHSSNEILFWQSIHDEIVDGLYINNDLEIKPMPAQADVDMHGWMVRLYVARFQNILLFPEVVVLNQGRVCFHGDIKTRGGGPIKLICNEQGIINSLQIDVIDAKFLSGLDIQIANKLILYYDDIKTLCWATTEEDVHYVCSLDKADHIQIFIKTRVDLKKPLCLKEQKLMVLGNVFYGTPRQDVVWSYSEKMRELPCLFWEDATMPAILIEQNNITLVICDTPMFMKGKASDEYVYIYNVGFHNTIHFKSNNLHLNLRNGGAVTIWHGEDKHTFLHNARMPSLLHNETIVVSGNLWLYESVSVYGKVNLYDGASYNRLNLLNNIRLIVEGIEAVSCVAENIEDAFCIYSATYFRLAGSFVFLGNITWMHVMNDVGVKQLDFINMILLPSTDSNEVNFLVADCNYHCYLNKECSFLVEQSVYTHNTTNSSAATELIFTEGTEHSCVAWADNVFCILSPGNIRVSQNISRQALYLHITNRAYKGGFNTLCSINLEWSEDRDKEREILFYSSSLDKGYNIKIHHNNFRNIRIKMTGKFINRNTSLFISAAKAELFLHDECNIVMLGDLDELSQHIIDNYDHIILNGQINLNSNISIRKKVHITGISDIELVGCKIYFNKIGSNNTFSSLAVCSAQTWFLSEWALLELSNVVLSYVYSYSSFTFSVLDIKQHMRPSIILHNISAPHFDISTITDASIVLQQNDRTEQLLLCRTKEGFYGALSQRYRHIVIMQDLFLNISGINIYSDLSLYGSCSSKTICVSILDQCIGVVGVSNMPTLHIDNNCTIFIHSNCNNLSIGNISIKGAACIETVVPICAGPTIDTRSAITINLIGVNVHSRRVIMKPSRNRELLLFSDKDDFMYAGRKYNNVRYIIDNNADVACVFCNEIIICGGPIPMGRTEIYGNVWITTPPACVKMNVVDILFQEDGVDNSILLIPQTEYVLTDSSVLDISNISMVATGSVTKYVIDVASGGSVCLTNLINDAPVVFRFSEIPATVMFDGLKVISCRKLSGLDIDACNNIELVGLVSEELINLHHAEIKSNVSLYGYGGADPIFLASTTKCSIIWDSKGKQAKLFFEDTSLNSMHKLKIKAPFFVLNGFQSLSRQAVFNIELYYEGDQSKYSIRDITGISRINIGFSQRFNGQISVEGNIWNIMTGYIIDGYDYSVNSLLHGDVWFVNSGIVNAGISVVLGQQISFSSSNFICDIYALNSRQPNVQFKDTFSFFVKGGTLILSTAWSPNSILQIILLEGHNNIDLNSWIDSCKGLQITIHKKATGTIYNKDHVISTISSTYNILSDLVKKYLYIYAILSGDITMPDVLQIKNVCLTMTSGGIEGARYIDMGDDKRLQLIEHLDKSYVDGFSRLVLCGGASLFLQDLSMVGANAGFCLDWCANNSVRFMNTKQTLCSVLLHEDSNGIIMNDDLKTVHILSPQNLSRHILFSGESAALMSGDYKLYEDTFLILGSCNILGGVSKINMYWSKDGALNTSFICSNSAPVLYMKGKGTPILINGLTAYNNVVLENLAVVNSESFQSVVNVIGGHDTSVTVKNIFVGGRIDVDYILLLDSSGSVCNINITYSDYARMFDYGFALLDISRFECRYKAHCVDRVSIFCSIYGIDYNASGENSIIVCNLKSCGWETVDLKAEGIDIYDKIVLCKLYAGYELQINIDIDYGCKILLDGATNYAGDIKLVCNREHVLHVGYVLESLWLNKMAKKSEDMVLFLEPGIVLESAQIFVSDVYFVSDSSMLLINGRGVSVSRQISGVKSNPIDIYSLADELFVLDGCNVFLIGSFVFPYNNTFVFAKRGNFADLSCLEYANQIKISSYNSGHIVLPDNEYISFIHNSLNLNEIYGSDIVICGDVTTPSTMSISNRLSFYGKLCLYRPKYSIWISEDEGDARLLAQELSIEMGAKAKVYIDDSVILHVTSLMITFVDDGLNSIFVVNNRVSINDIKRLWFKNNGIFLLEGVPFLCLSHVCKLNDCSRVLQEYSTNAVLCIASETILSGEGVFKQDVSICGIHDTWELTAYIKCLKHYDHPSKISVFFDEATIHLYNASLFLSSNLSITGMLRLKLRSFTQHTVDLSGVDLLNSNITWDIYDGSWLFGYKDILCSICNSNVFVHDISNSNISALWIVENIVMPNMSVRINHSMELFPIMPEASSASVMDYIKQRAYGGTVPEKGGDRINLCIVLGCLEIENNAHLLLHSGLEIKVANYVSLGANSIWTVYNGDLNYMFGSIRPKHKAALRLLNTTTAKGVSVGFFDSIEDVRISTSNNYYDIIYLLPGDYVVDGDAWRILHPIQICGGDRISLGKSSFVVDALTPEVGLSLCLSVPLLVCIDKGAQFSLASLSVIIKDRGGIYLQTGSISINEVKVFQNSKTFIYDEYCNGTISISNSQIFAYNAGDNPIIIYLSPLNYTISDIDAARVIYSFISVHLDVINMIALYINSPYKPVYTEVNMSAMNAQNIFFDDHCISNLIINTDDPRVYLHFGSNQINWAYDLISITNTKKQHVDSWFVSKLQSCERLKTYYSNEQNVVLLLFDADYYIDTSLLLGKNTYLIARDCDIECSEIVLAWRFGTQPSKHEMMFLNKDDYYIKVTDNMALSVYGDIIWKCDGKLIWIDITNDDFLLNLSDVTFVGCVDLCIEGFGRMVLPKEVGPYSNKILDAGKYDPIQTDILFCNVNVLLLHPIERNVSVITPMELFYVDNKLTINLYGNNRDVYLPSYMDKGLVCNGGHINIDGRFLPRNPITDIILSAQEDTSIMFSDRCYDSLSIHDRKFAIEIQHSIIAKTLGIGIGNTVWFDNSNYAYPDYKLHMAWNLDSMMQALSSSSNQHKLIIVTQDIVVSELIIKGNVCILTKNAALPTNGHWYDMPIATIYIHDAMNSLGVIYGKTSNQYLFLLKDCVFVKLEGVFSANKLLRLESENGINPVLIDISLVESITSMAIKLDAYSLVRVTPTNSYIVVDSMSRLHQVCHDGGASNIILAPSFVYNNVAPIIKTSISLYGACVVSNVKQTLVEINDEDINGFSRFKINQPLVWLNLDYDGRFILSGFSVDNFANYIGAFIGLQPSCKGEIFLENIKLCDNDNSSTLYIIDDRSYKPHYIYCRHMMWARGAIVYWHPSFITCPTLYVDIEECDWDISKTICCHQNDMACVVLS